MSEMKIENHFAQGAIVNNGQMNVGGGTIHVHVQGQQQVAEEATEAENATRNPQLSVERVLQYVMKLHPSYVRQEWQDKYGPLWKSVLELPEVAKLIGDKGKQKDTTFNRNLVGNILHLMLERKVFVPTAHATRLAMALEGDANASIRAKLGEMPVKKVKDEVERLISAPDSFVSRDK